jgi:hypothetical protein
MTLELEDTGTTIVTLTQSFRLPNRATGEIIGGAMRAEAENNRQAQWRTWGPSELTAFRDRTDPPCGWCGIRVSGHDDLAEGHEFLAAKP